MSEKHVLSENKQKIDTLHLNDLTTPIYTVYIKPGNTLCANENAFVVQNGSTMIELRTPPKFEPRKIPWRDGLFRDIVWCSQLGVFVLLTQKTIFTFDPNLITTPVITNMGTNDIYLKISAYNQIKPFEDRHSFWRCTSVDTRIFIAYSGFATIIDEYMISPSSCNLIKRWLPPQTCGEQEGIWCIRHHPNTNEIGMTIMNGETNQWRFELRHSRDLSTLWQLSLPLTHGDCEISPLMNGEWLAVNSCGVRLFHISNQRLKAAVEYERELRNAIPIANKYFVIRTKNTLEIHLINNDNSSSSSSSLIK